MTPVEVRGPRPRDADATRTALLTAAMRRFTLLGYERTTTRDVAADAGANVSLIARYFGSKEGLFTAVLEASADAVGEGPGDDDATLVDTIVRGLAEGTWPEFGGEHPLQMLVRGAGDSDAVAALRRRALHGAADRLLGLARAEGRVGTGRGADARLRAEALVGAVAGLLSVRSALPDGTLAAASPAKLRTLVGQVVDGLFPPGT